MASIVTAPAVESLAVFCCIHRFEVADEPARFVIKNVFVIFRQLPTLLCDVDQHIELLRL